MVAQIFTGAAYRLWKLLHLDVEFLQRSGEQSAVFANCGLGLIIGVFWSGLSDEHDASVGPRARTK